MRKCKRTLVSFVTAPRQGELREGDRRKSLCSMICAASPVAWCISWKSSLFIHTHTVPSLLGSATEPEGRWAAGNVKGPNPLRPTQEPVTSENPSCPYPAPVALSSIHCLSLIACCAKTLYKQWPQIPECLLRPTKGGKVFSFIAAGALEAQTAWVSWKEIQISLAAVACAHRLPLIYFERTLNNCIRPIYPW